MGDVGETFALYHAWKKAQRKDRAKVNLEALQASGLPFFQQSDGVWRCNASWGVVMYYPSSNTWQHKSGVHRGPVTAFINWFKRKEAHNAAQ